MDKNQLKTTASAVAARVNALGFTKSGQPMVIDQAFEVVAAAQGLRNQHVLRKSLKPAAASTGAVPASSDASAADALRAHDKLYFANMKLDQLQHDNEKWVELCRHQHWDDTTISSMMKEFLQDSDLWSRFVEYADTLANPCPELAELIEALEEPLDKEGYTVEQTDGAWSWFMLDAEASSDFPSQGQAWHDLISTICVRANIDPSELSSRPIAVQVAAICQAATCQAAQAAEDEREILELQRLHGVQHPEFSIIASAAALRLYSELDNQKAPPVRYWSWVLQKVREARKNAN